VSSDPEAFDRILLEILLNAVQAAPDGNVEVTADEPAGHSITVHVHDDGAGFTEESLRRATEPFYTTKTSGVGLGLTVADRLIQSLSGRLLLSPSRRLRGADVALTLPTHRP
jgi:signal transduction histidine kinase